MSKTIDQIEVERLASKLVAWVASLHLEHPEAMLKVRECLQGAANSLAKMVGAIEAGQDVLIALPVVLDACAFIGHVSVLRAVQEIADASGNSQVDASQN